MTAMNESAETLIVGAGAAGVQVASALRQGGYAGSIAIVNREEHAPYERPPLSKGFLRGEEEADAFLLQPPAFWAAESVRLIPGEQVVSVDPGARTVRTDRGTRLRYGTLVWAAGGRARRLDLPGADLIGVYSIRTLADAAALRADLVAARSAVIIGGGHIGLEAAAAFRARGLAVTVVEVQDRLLARVTGPEVSAFYQSAHREAGVDVRLNAAVERIDGHDGRVCGVHLVGGEALAADIVIVGIGMIPNVEPLREAGITCSNGVDVDAEGRTDVPDIYAAGDCANSASAFAGGARVRLESVPHAVECGKIVAAGIIGAPSPVPSPPWFWSYQYDLKLRTVGLMAGCDRTVVRGDPATRRFTVVYARQGRVIALDCVNTMRDFAQGRLLVAAGLEVDVDALGDPALALKSLLPQA